MTGRKGDIKRAVAFTIIIASLLTGMTFIMSEDAFASDSSSSIVVVRDRPFFRPFFNPFINPFLFNRFFFNPFFDFEDLFFDPEDFFFERERFEDFDFDDFDRDRFPRGLVRERERDDD
jgi:hypothetical protein